jgi:hypothetical protein
MKRVIATFRTCGLIDYAQENLVAMAVIWIMTWVNFLAFNDHKMPMRGHIKPIDQEIILA